MLNAIRLLIILSSLLMGTSFANSSLHIVTSILPLNALAAGVAEGVTEPIDLVPANVSHHHYTLKPSNAQALEQADVVVWIGPSLETFLQKPIANLNSKTSVITVEKLPGLTLYPIRENANWQAHGNAHSNEAHTDPHLWLDPQNAITIINALATNFSEKDPNYAKIYKQNAAKMIKQIETLDNELKKELAPLKDKPFLVFHDGYQYFEKHYHLNAAGSITVDSDLPPSAQRLFQIHRQIEQQHITCLFAEAGTSSAIITALQRDTQVKVGMLDTMGKGQHFSDYLDLLQFNANSLLGCL